MIVQRTMSKKLLRSTEDFNVIEPKVKSTQKQDVQTWLTCFSRFTPDSLLDTANQIRYLSRLDIDDWSIDVIV